LADFGFSDPDDDPENTLKDVIITSLPNAGQLLLDGVAVEIGDRISANLITAGKLAYAPASGVFGAPLASFDFGLMDQWRFRRRRRDPVQRVNVYI